MELAAGSFDLGIEDSNLVGNRDLTFF